MLYVYILFPILIYSLPVLAALSSRGIRETERFIGRTYANVTGQRVDVTLIDLQMAKGLRTANHLGPKSRDTVHGEDVERHFFGVQDFDRHELVKKQFAEPMGYR